MHKNLYIDPWLKLMSRRHRTRERHSSNPYKSATDLDRALQRERQRFLDSDLSLMELVQQREQPAEESIVRLSKYLSKRTAFFLLDEKWNYPVDVVERLSHSFGEWVTVGNKQQRVCTLCSHMECKVNTDGGNVEIESPEQPGLDFDVDHVEPSDQKYVLVEEAVNEAGDAEREVLKVFDITLKNGDGYHVQPDGSVKVKLPLDWDKEGNYKVYRVNDDKSLTDMSAYRQGSHMVFETDHFSLYIIVEEASAAMGDLNLDGEVDASDLTLLARHVAKIELLQGAALTNADVDSDGDVDAEDLTVHARYVAKIITQWPAA